MTQLQLVRLTRLQQAHAYQLCRLGTKQLLYCCCWQSASTETKTKDYAFQHQCDEKPSIILGCPGASTGLPCSAESDAAASGEAFHSLQARQQALQSSLAQHTVCSNASQHSLQQQLQSLHSELQAVRQERHVALAGLKALQMCDEKRKCSLHVGLSQVSHHHAVCLVTMCVTHGD